MNIRKVKNVNLITEIGASGVIEIFDLTEDNLKLLGFMDDDGWPSGEMLKIIDDLEKIAPTEFQNNPQYFDIIDNGFKIYNKFIEKVEERGQKNE